MSTLDSILKSRDITLPTKVCLVKAMVFPVAMYGCESWTIKKSEHQRIDALSYGVLEDSWESLGLQEIKPVQLKGNQTWIFIGRTDAEAEAPIFWLPDTTSWLIRKDPDDGKDLGQKEKGMTEIGWHHQLNCHEFKQAVGDGEGPGFLAWCSPWGHKELNMTEWLNHNKKNVNSTLNQIPT